MTLMELTRALYAKTGWSKQTIITLLNRMVEKGIVSFVQEGRTKWFSLSFSLFRNNILESSIFYII